MAIETTNVTVRVNDQTGNPVPSAIVSAKLMTTEKNTGFVLPKEVTGETNDSGVVVLAVFPNELGTEGSEYQFRIEDPRTGKVVKIFAVVPNADCELHTISELDRYELRGAGEVISSTVAANAATASAAATTATTAATTATTKAGEASASATSAASNATSASSSAAAAATAVSKLPGGAPKELCYISAGVIAPTVALVAVDTEGLAATDDLTNIDITNLADGSIVTLYQPNPARTVTIKNAAGGNGQIYTAYSQDKALGGLPGNDAITLYRIGNYWYELSFSSANIPNAVAGGLGEFKPYTGTLAAAAVLPTGVKWAYFLIAIQTGAVVAGVANGGTTVGAATAGVTWSGFMWRVL